MNCQTKYSFSPATRHMSQGEEVPTTDQTPEERLRHALEVQEAKTHGSSPFLSPARMASRLSRLSRPNSGIANKRLTKVRLQREVRKTHHSPLESSRRDGSNERAFRTKITLRSACRRRCRCRANGAVRLASKNDLLFIFSHSRRFRKHA